MKWQNSFTVYLTGRSYSCIVLGLSVHGVHNTIHTIHDTYYRLYREKKKKYIYMDPKLHWCTAVHSKGGSNFQLPCHLYICVLHYTRTVELSFVLNLELNCHVMLYMVRNHQDEYPYLNLHFFFFLKIYRNIIFLVKLIGQ